MLKLFAVMLGGRAEGALIELHDVVFVTGNAFEETYPKLVNKWFGIQKRVHVDSFVELKYIDGFEIQLSQTKPHANPEQNLFFLNFGGYKAGIFGETHDVGFYVAPTKPDAVLKAKKELCIGLHEQHVDDHMHLNEIMNTDISWIDDVIEINSVDQYYIHLIPTDKPTTLDIQSYYQKLDVPHIIERANALKKHLVMPA